MLDSIGNYIYPFNLKLCHNLHIILVGGGFLYLPRLIRCPKILCDNFRAFGGVCAKSPEASPKAILLDMDKKIIVRNFSRYANLYDRYADVQRRAGAELLRLINGKRGFNKILEIGCGTGNYTLLLREKFKNAKIKALDICNKMIEVAHQKLKDRNVEFIVRDAEDVNLGERFDFITSNACLQWFTNLEKALMKYNGLLKKEGVILFSIFGPSTFCELNYSLKHIFKNASVEANNFITKGKIEKILNKRFKGIKIKECIYQESFPRLKDLLCKIKYSGIRGSGSNCRIQFTNRILQDLEEFYLFKFKEIKATYQVFFCLAKKYN